MARSLNKVELIGNLTRDPELRYTPQGTPVCSFGLATNRSWTTDSGEKKEEAEFHRIVAWNKLAELCSQLLSKGRKIYVEGRLSNRSWTGQDGAQRSITEIIINDMIILDSRRDLGEQAHEAAHDFVEAAESPTSAKKPVITEDTEKDIENTEIKAERTKKDSGKIAAAKKTVGEVSDEVNPDDIPF